MRNGQLGVVTRFEFFRLFKSAPGVLFLVFFCLVYAYIGAKLVEWQDDLAQNPEWSLAQEAMEGADLNSEAMAKHNPIYQTVSWVTDLEEAEIARLVHKHSAILLALFALTIMLIPGLVLVLSMDQTGSDISRRHARFLVVRVDRATIYIGKTLAVVMFWALAALLGTVVMAAICMNAGPAGADSQLSYFARMYGSIVVLGLPFITLAGMAAAMTGHAMIGGVVTFGLWGFVALASWALGRVWDGASYLGYLFPTHRKYEMLSDDAGRIMAIAGYQIGYAAIAFFLGLWIFKRRDV